MKKYMDFAYRGNDGSGVEECCLVIDVSPSMDCEDLKPSRLAAAKEAAKALVGVKCAEHSDDRIAIVSFSSDASLVADMGGVTDPEILRKLDGLRTSSATNIRAGLNAAKSVFKGKCFGSPLQRFTQWASRAVADPLMERAASMRSETRRIILLSDGKHNTGGSPESVAEDLKADGVVIDVIGVGGSSTADEFDEKQLKRIASKNPDRSARYVFINDTKELVRHFESLGHHLKRLGG